ncbi:MAG: hypothetical protein CMF62_09405 [Magnetococcales bacterium]|nr:hypothetical protein [Magnetococcales bacterium]
MEAHLYQDMPHLKRCTEWVIAFTPYRGQNLLKKHLLSPLFGHVWAFTEVQGNTLILAPFEGGYFAACTKQTNSESGVGITPAILSSALLREGAQSAVQLLYYKSRLPRNKTHMANVLPSCVTMVKLMLGFRSWALTPRQLYGALLRRGAVPIDPDFLNLMLAADKNQRRQCIEPTPNT